MNAASKNNILHKVFDISLVLKGMHAVVEIAGGVLIFFITKAYIIDTVLSLTQEELSEDPNDLVAHYFITLSNNLPLASQHFIALYLLSHGVIKLFLIVNLYKGKLWAYPLSIAVFGFFIMYQLYRFSSSHSSWLLLLTLFDIVIIWLTFREYSSIKNIQLSKR